MWCTMASVLYPLRSTWFLHLPIFVFLHVSCVYSSVCPVATHLDFWFICGHVNMIFSPCISNLKLLTLVTKETQNMEGSNWHCYIHLIKDLYKYEKEKYTKSSSHVIFVFLPKLLFHCWMRSQGSINSVNKNCWYPWGLNYNADTRTFICRSASPRTLETY
jgi:hypothetical protein